MSDCNNFSRRVNVIEGNENLELSAVNVIGLQQMENRNTSSWRSTDSRKEIYEKAMRAIEQTEHLMNRNHLQLPQSSRDSSSFTSSATEDPTVDLNLNVDKQCNFNPSEMTGRSTECATTDTSISVEQILSESHCSHVRALADELIEFKIRESHCGELPRTADISLTSVKTFRSSMSRPDDWPERHDMNLSGTFIPSDRVKDFLRDEEDRWTKDYASLTSDSDLQSEDNGAKNSSELSDFARFRYGNQSACESNASLGQFFNKKSYDVREILPNLSPTKQGRPIALLDSFNTTSDTLADDEILSKPMVPPNNTKNGTLASESLISISTIENYMHNCKSDDSPRTITNNLLKLKSAVAKKIPPVERPLQTTYATESLPLKAQNSNSNVNIVKVEKFIGDVSALRDPQISANHLKTKSTYLTPSGQHIRRNHFFNKENQEVCRELSNQNAFNKNSPSSETLSMSSITDTLSMSGVPLSSSKIQAEKPLSNTKNELLNSNICESDENESQSQSAVSPTPINSQDQEVTPTNSPTRRKRTRSKDRTLTPNNPALLSTPVRSKLDVLYNPKHRLASPANRMDVLHNSKHRLNTALATSPDPSNSHARHFVTSPQSSHLDNPKSPKLLAQSNSQFSSVSDLREFSVKSSQSVISWPSQKLRTRTVKQFTIKNIGGKKLTMKIEVIGPGFQLSASEPFQLIALQAQECRTISVSFCPTIIGSAVGKLNFCHAKDTAERSARKIIPLFGYGGHTVLEVQGVSQGVVGYPFLQLGTTSDLLNMQLNGAFSIYNKGPLKGVAIIRVKSDTKKPTSGGTASTLTITPSKSVIGPDGSIRIEVVYRPRKNDVRKLLTQDGNVLGVATLEVFMADEPSRQRILGLINKFATNSSDVYLLDDLFRGIPIDEVENFRDFHETEDMIAELFNKMKSTEIVLTVKRSTMDQTIESEHDFFLSDTNESMFFHTLVSDEGAMPPIPPSYSAPSKNCDPSSSSCLTPMNPVVPLYRQGLARSTGQTWYVQPSEIHLNPGNVDRATSKIEIHSNSTNRQIFEIISNYRNMFVIEPECGVINPGLIATVSISVKNNRLINEPNESPFIRIRVDKKREIDVPVIIDRADVSKSF